MMFRILGILLLMMGTFLQDGFYAKGPEIVNIGSVFTFNTTIGKVAKIAIQAAIDDVNSSPQVLLGTNLSVTMQDAKFSGFLGMFEAMALMEKNVVAIIGPQSSVTAHSVSILAEGVQIPLISFAATDPTLSSLEYPYFVRTTQNDVFQMTAISDIVNFFGWKKVTAIYTDDDYGRNGIAALGDKLEERQCVISYKAVLGPDPTREDIMQVLFQVALQESRILVLHTYINYGLDVLDVAASLGMLDSGYVWIATNWLTDYIDTNSPLSSRTLSNVQGLLALRMHTPQSQLKRNFVARWKDLIKRENVNSSFGLNSYGLYAYDTVWILAHALDTYFSRGGNISFSDNTVSSQLKASTLHLDKMSAFNGGELLLSIIQQVNITGVTGHIQFASDRNLINPAYDIINLLGTGHNTIGYWSNSSGLSVQPPENIAPKLPNQTSSSPQLLSVIWPGQTSEKPRGWVFPNNGKLLRIGVPRRVVYKQFVSYSPSTDSFTGFCIDVFTSAVNLLPYALPYKLIPFGDGKNDPDISELVDTVSTGVFDAVIGDIAITTNRTRKVDFTQPYIESGLVVVAPVKAKDSHAWAFLRPFSPTMWLITAAFFLTVGSVVWILEHRHNDEFRGTPRQQIATILWFSCSTWFFAHRETTVSSLGRFVLIIWLFVVLIINSNYTASLTSMLTVKQLTSQVKGIHSLIVSDEPIGYRVGSFAYDYLREELRVPASRLIVLKSEDDCADALRKGPQNGGIAALVDKIAYMEVFLSTRCEFTIVGQEFTKNGWGFAFPQDSALATDMSTALLKLSENGDLQRIHDKWLLRSGACSSQDTQLAVDRLELQSFWGLFLICGVACVLALIIYFGTMLKQFIQHYSAKDDDPFDINGQTSSGSSRLQTFISFIDEKEEESKRRVKKRQVEDSPTNSSTPRYGTNLSIANMSRNSSGIVKHVEFSLAQNKSGDIEHNLDT